MSLRDIDATTGYCVGPMVELRLPWRFTLEGNLLFRRLHGEQARLGGNPPWFAYGLRGSSWDLPILLQIDLLRRAPHPYVAAGTTLQWVTGSRSRGVMTELRGNPPVLVTRTVDEPLPRQFDPGYVLGGGIRIPIRRLRLSPAVRFSHWFNRESRAPRIPFGEQVEFVLGVGVRLR